MRKVLVVVVLLAAAVAGGYFWLQDTFFAPGPSTDIVRIQVEQGASVRSVLAELEKQGALKHARAVELYLRLTRHVKGHQPRIQVGMYEIPAGASPEQILELFDQGRVVLEQLTVIEGSRFADLRHTLDNHAAVTHTLQGKTDEEVMTALGHPGEFPEGRFFRTPTGSQRRPPTLRYWDWPTVPCSARSMKPGSSEALIFRSRPPTRL